MNNLCMTLELTEHAKERMLKYGITNNMVISAVNASDAVVPGYGGRMIYQKRLNGYVIRVIVEEHKNVKRVITVYKARSVRYEI